MKRLPLLFSALLLSAVAQASITSVSPSFGRPRGGELVRIRGNWFEGPVRVLFDVGNGPLPLEAFVVSLSSTDIEVITPAVDLLFAQQRIATIHVLTRAGTMFEQRSTLHDCYTYRNDILEPRISAVTPNSGPSSGGMRVTIFGEGFQSPVQVLVYAGDGGGTEVRVITVQFDLIVVEMPTASEAGVAEGQSVHLYVVNVQSGARTVMHNAFRYLKPMQITSISPTIGPAAGGTDLRISGVGFDTPLAVYVGDVQAQPINVSGTLIIARTLPSQSTTCSDVPAPVRVVNVATGEVVSGPDFTYVAARPIILRVAPRIAPIGSVVEVDLVNANGTSALIGLGHNVSFTAPISQSTVRFTVPDSPNYPRTACTVAGIDGTGPAAFEADLTITDSIGCTVAETILVLPAEDAACTIPPTARVIAPDTGRCLRFGRGIPRTQKISIRNSDLPGTSLLYVLQMGLTGADARDFELALASPNPWAAAGATVDFNVTFKDSSQGYRTARAELHTNDPEKPVISVCLTGLRF